MTATTDLERIATSGLIFDVRPDTTDAKAIHEVVDQRVYLQRGVTIERGERWLDLGGNIGSFSVMAAALGAEVFAYEAHPDNARMLSHNLKINGLHGHVEHAAVLAEPEGPLVELFVASSGRNLYRHTIIPTLRRQSIPVPTVAFNDILDRYQPDGIKLDIEGAELAILDTCRFDGVQKMAFEYHFNADRVVANLMARMERLRRWFDHVETRKMPANSPTWDFYPDACIVSCWNSHR